MNKALQAIIEKVKSLPEERQRYAAEVLEQIVASNDELYEMTEEEERLVQEALDDPRPPASEAEVRTVFDKYLRK